MMFSVTSRRAIRPVPAPSITRTATSGSRAEARTSTSVATLVTASSSTRAPRRQRSHLPVGPADDALPERNRRELGDAVPEVAPEREDSRALIPARSAAAISMVTPSLSRPMPRIQKGPRRTGAGSLSAVHAVAVTPPSSFRPGRKHADDLVGHSVYG